MARKAGVTAEETRRELLDATMRVLLERGYEGTRISEIARVAGVTSGAIYNHFASKADLLGQAISEHSPDVISELLAGAGAGSVIDVFRAIGAALPDRADELAPVILELVVAGTRAEDVAATVRGGFADKERAATDVIRLAQEAGEVDASLDAEALARFTTMVALGSLVTSALELKPVDHAAWEAVIDRVLDSVRSKPDPGSPDPGSPAPSRTGREP